MGFHCTCYFTKRFFHLVMYYGRVSSSDSEPDHILLMAVLYSIQEFSVSFN